MAIRKLGLLLVATLPAAALAGETPATPAIGYHRAPDAIARILEATPVPTVSVSPDHRTLAILGRENLPTIANLSKAILRLAGERIDPATNGPAKVKVGWLTAITFKDVASGHETRVALPTGVRLAVARWSPDGRTVAFLVQEADGLALWVAGSDGRARMLARGINGAFEGYPYVWSPDSRAIVARRVVTGRGTPPAPLIAPTSPIVQESNGRRSAARTYEDLLATRATRHCSITISPASSCVSTRRAARRRRSASREFTPMSTSRLMAATCRPSKSIAPYSYLQPREFFPTTVAVWTINGHPVKTIVDRPLADNLPVDSTQR